MTDFFRDGSRFSIVAVALTYVVSLKCMVGLAGAAGKGMLCALLNPDNTSTQPSQSIDTVLATASLYAPVIREADRTAPDALATAKRSPLDDDAAAAAIADAIRRIEGTQELSADDILEVADKISSAAFAAKTKVEMVTAAPIPAEAPTLEELPLSPDKSQEIVIDEDPQPTPQVAAPIVRPPVAMPAPLRPDDTWQALGRALATSQPSVMVDDPNARPVREAESIYPVEVPIHAAPVREMTGTFEAWASRHPSGDASLSLRLPVQRPRFAQAKWIVGGVSGVSALLCLIAIVVSAASNKDASAPPSPAIQVEAPATQTQVPQASTASTHSSTHQQSVREDHSFDVSGDMSASGNGWTKSVMGSTSSGAGSANVVPAATDAPGVSIDSLPKAGAKKKTWKRH